MRTSHTKFRSTLRVVPALIMLASIGSVGLVAFPAAHAAPAKDMAGLTRLVKTVLADAKLTAKVAAVRS